MKVATIKKNNKIEVHYNNMPKQFIIVKEKKI
jgi:hypothetical protein